jgi:hypothetical protein
VGEFGATDKGAVGGVGGKERSRRASFAVGLGDAEESAVFGAVQLVSSSKLTTNAKEE